jgi:transposase
VYSKNITSFTSGVREVIPPQTRHKTWFLLPSGLTIGGKLRLDPTQKCSLSAGNRLEYSYVDKENVMSKPGKRLEQIERVHPNAAGLDIGAREIFGCVPPDREGETVKVFGTFTPDLHSLADWLAANQVDTVAMESTGVYWIPVFELLESRGFRVYLVNARHIKNVPGRKSDFQDCQWIQKLHMLGLLTSSFRPDAEMCALRAYLRHRADLLQHRAAHILHMQKALQQMNIQLAQVLSDITGETGLSIIRAIMSGERDSVKLAQLRNHRCKSSQDSIAKALTGTWQAEHLFALKQSLEFYDFYTSQIAACDAQVQQQYAVMKPRWKGASSSFSLSNTKPTRKNKQKSEPTFDVRTPILQLTGVDLAAVGGIGSGLAQTILSEIGTDMSKWATDKQFTSWLGLAPHNDISGGKVLRSRLLPSRNRAGQAFRQAATSVARSQSALGAYYRRKRAQAGPLFAQVATAHKIARGVYHMLKYHVEYQDIGAELFDRKQREREIGALRKKAAKLGFTLNTPELAQAIP